MKKIIVEIKKKSDTLKILAKIYTWIALGCSIFLMFFDITNVFLLIKMAIVLAFLYNKNNWRMAVMVLSVVTIIYTLWNIETLNFLGLVDIAGFSAVFMYALKERK
jgi:hypothetical protein